MPSDSSPENRKLLGCCVGCCHAIDHRFAGVQLVAGKVIAVETVEGDPVEYWNEPIGPPKPPPPSPLET